MDMPNIMSASQEHDRYCTQPNMGERFDLWGRPGDVKRCRHGKVMLGYEVPGLIPAKWMTLSPIWTPIRYRRAVRALQEQA
jgi:hypothetical protein